MKLLFSIVLLWLFGLEKLLTAKIINQICADLPTTTTMESIYYTLITPCNKSIFPLTQPENILESSNFDPNKKLAILVNGWRSRPEADYVAHMANAFNCRGDYNFLVLDSADYKDTFYFWSAYNTAEVGRHLALGLEKLKEKIPVESIHLIGQGLGAHIVGNAGRYFTTNTGLNITRITGLDPANPCLLQRQALSGLQLGDAAFIDIIHSNIGATSQQNSEGDANFYPEIVQTQMPGYSGYLASHGHAHDYFIESIYPGNEKNFLAVHCTSLTDWYIGFCNGPKHPMGLAVPNNIKGNYFLHVNAIKPYGQNHNDRHTVSSDCGKCEGETSK